MSEAAPSAGPVVNAGGEAPVEAANGQNQANARQPSKMESAMAIIKSLIIRALIIYFVTSFFRKPAPAVPGPNQPAGAATAARNMFMNGSDLALHVYLSEREDMRFEDGNLFWFKDHLIYGDWTSGINNDGTYERQKDIPVSRHMQNNGSLFLHAFVTRYGESPNPKEKNYGRTQVLHTRKALNRFKMLKASITKNLISGVTEKEEVEDGKIVSHWHPNITLNLVTDQTAWSWGSVPAPLNEFIEFTDDGKLYKPILYVNDFWNMAKDYKPLNTTSYTLKIIYQPLSLFKWQLYAAQGMRQKYFNFFGDNENEPNDEEQDTLKETLLDTNPYLLALTIVVSIVHSVFELLAFKNDIQFWNNRNSLEGLSVKSVFFGVFQSVIVLLYVLDNETNTVVRISCFVGLCIELWKIRKVLDINFANGKLNFKEKTSYVESNTKEYDNLAFKYLSWVCFPLLFGYSIYALVYLEHKGWYSFVLDLLYGYLLTFGFIMMTPQLFINYKLKSVAHLPWRMLTYKFLNTFIDDMFAFVIKMPTMYRIGCFRDDIIFLIYLYQRWIYPVDKMRTNEFGYGPEQEQKAVENKASGDQVEAIEGSENDNEKNKDGKSEAKKTK